MEVTKIVVMGRAGVGKSALVVRYLTKRFIWEYDPTLESTYKHTTNIDEEQVYMEILDTAGQEENISRESYVKWADGFILVYSITDKQSFDDVLQIKQYLDDVKRTNTQCVLVGNKVDLLHDRKVSYDEGESIAQEMSAAFFETSVSDGGEDIIDVFHELHREVKRRKMMEIKGRRRSSAQQVRHVFNRMLNKIGNGT
ncbi:hypothetical protein LOTGIDRAFT_104078 [Lottia gigantea]|uniref:small monomeric GTPase n=1 Tax=Lottia gigantea TaxID=225164 RepID=V4AS15_LOTGI|nr:hypothetical protein LOTGIDRAFT_104078 [Lottia gigantea]ESO97655.1 hypothetical protein LOTGIDRAFT_104078 [Lottia gigantea]